MKKILIIGGTGFIGLNLIKKLVLYDYDLFSISTQLPLKIKKIKKVKYIQLDITKKKEFKKLNNFKFDIVINLGGYIDHSNLRKTFKSHYEGAKNIIKYFNNRNLKLLIQAGSSLEYGNTASPHKENLTCRPKSNYGLAKYKTTNFIKKYRNRRFSYIILRLYQIYGPNQDTSRLIPFVIKSCLEKNFFKCTSGNQLRDFLYIDDLINLFIKIIKSKRLDDEIYNVGSGKMVSVKHIINSIYKNIKKGKPLFGKISMRKDEDLKLYPIIKKVKETFDWTPKTSLQIGLKKTISFYKKN
jgi:nucleoside-diphosphate-sugar epimerase